MVNKNQKKYHYIISSREYDRIKNNWQSKIKGIPKPDGFMSSKLKQKISNSNKGISRNKGTKFSEETKVKISDSKKGKPLSQQHIENLKIGIKNRKKWVRSSRKVNQYDLEENFIREWNNIAEVKKYHKGGIQACCQGRQKKAGGFIWKYKN